MTPGIEYFMKHIADYSTLLLITDGFHERPTIQVAKPVIQLITSNGSDDKFADMPYRTIKMKNDI